MKIFSTTQKRLSRRKVQITIFGSMSLVCMIVTAFLAVQVFVKLDHYGSTPIDNIQWTMSQLEVEQIKLATALERLEDPTEDTITHARQRFDILYSRANAMKNGSGYRAALDGSAADHQLDIIFSELTDMLAFFDTSDAALIAERATLLDATNALTPAIRRLSSEAISIGAKAAQAERTSLTSTLQKMALMSLLMVTAMLSLMWLLWRLYTLYRHRAFQNRITLNRLSTILDTSEDAILVVRPDGTIIETNTAARSMFGPDNTETGKSNIYGVLYRQEEDRTLTAISDEPLGDVREGEADSTPLVARRQDGSLAAVELSANVAARSVDEVWVCFIRDISDRLAAEAEVQAARDKALSNEKAKAHFLGRISHEMRTPLHGILGTLDLMDSTPLSPEQSRYSDIMKSSGQVLLNQINDALDITRSSAEPLPLVETVFDVEQLIEDIATSQGAVADAHGNTIDLHVQNAPVGAVLGDRDRVQQVLLNLVSNAIKFTRNGRISIEAARVGLHGKHDNIVEIQVSDTGIGIAEDDVERIFDDFVRVISSDGERTEGTGLGLGIARNLVLQMGGDIGVESLLGEGSVFWVRLPLRAAGIDREAALKDTSKTVAQSIAPKDILIIEDNPTNRFVLKVMLEKQGHRVSLAVDGETGVALSRVRSFDLVVVDVNMPGIDGGEATRRIRSGNGASARTRIVALSAYIDANTRETLMKSGVDDVHIKPLRMADLERVLTGKGPRQPKADFHETLDPAVTKQLKSALTEDRFYNLVQGLTQESSDILKALENLDRIDPESMARQLHKFAGIAATVGAIAVRDILCRAETAAKAGDIAELEKELHAFSKTWEKTLRHLNAQDKAA